MLNLIKSKYIRKLPFNFLDDVLKLKIVKYNKTLQNLLNISLINYIVCKGRFIIYETKIKGKEYNKEGKLIYEGEYLNGKRNGKGKEYNEDGELEFEGEYNNGKRNGVGKEYLKGKLIFEGEYKNGNIFEGVGFESGYNIAFILKEGKGFVKKYNKNKNLIFIGEYLNGQRNGRGKEYNKELKLIFDGEFLNGEKNGNGKEYYYNGNIKFFGEYKKGKKFNGKGYDINQNIIYELKEGKGLIKELDDYGKLIFGRKMRINK